MREITVLSGKGGTGKTTITAALAALFENSVLCDNDVDASDLHLILNPVIEEIHVFKGAWLAEIDEGKCNMCGICFEECRYDAIILDAKGRYHIDELKCEGCRLCERICPQKAIRSRQSLKNKWFVSSTRFGQMIHAALVPGEENSGKLVSLIRQEARKIAEHANNDFLLNDGPPGIGCSAIASVTGSDAVLLVIEPTLSGLHDIQRLNKLVNSFNIPQFAIINKYDINPEMTHAVIAYLKKEKIPLLGQIPYDEDVVKAMLEGKSVVEYRPDSNLASVIREVWKVLQSHLNKLS